MAYFHDNGDGRRVDHLARAQEHLDQVKAALAKSAAPAVASRPVQLPTTGRARLKAPSDLSDSDWDQLAQATSPDHACDHDRLCDVLVASLPNGVADHRDLPEEDRTVLHRSVETAAHRYLESLGPDASEKMATAIHMASTGRSLNDPQLARAYLNKAAQTWQDIPTTAAIRREVDFLEKRAKADEEAQFAARCRAKAAELHRRSAETSDYALSRDYEIAAGLLERDAVQGKAAQAERLARAASDDRDAENRAIERARWEKEWRNR